MASTRCAGCGSPFTPRPQTPKQTFCPAAGCQRERRRRWQQQRRHADPAYLENQGRAQSSWVGRNPGYWRAYRAAHPEYVERNRELQHGRDAARRLHDLAKMDASTRESPIPSGTYHLSPVTRPHLAKMDVWTVQITVVSMGCNGSG